MLLYPLPPNDLLGHDLHPREQEVLGISRLHPQQGKRRGLGQVVGGC